MTDEVSLEIVIELVTSEALQNTGWILDGFPRTTEQVGLQARVCTLIWTRRVKSCGREEKWKGRHSDAV